MIQYAPTLTIINYSVIFIFLVAVALAAMSSLSDSLLTTLFFIFYLLYNDLILSNKRVLSSLSHMSAMV